MTQMARGVWKTMTVSPPVDITQNAAAVADWLKTLKPDAAALYIVRDDQSTSTAPTGTMFFASLFNNVPYTYIRYYNNGRQGGSGWTSAYYLNAHTDETFTVFYQ